MKQLRIVLALCVVALAFTSPATASTTLRLEATDHMQTWRSPNILDPNHPLTLGVWVNGKDISSRGHVEGTCRYTLFTRRLALEMANCGRSKLTIRYVGSTRFTFFYRAESGFF